MSEGARDMLAAPVWQALDSPVIIADCLDVMRSLPAASVDAVVTDPPYGLSREPDMREVLDHWLAGDDFVHRGGGFMGQSWDSMVPGPSVWREAHRVLKPGGYLLAFGGSRTYDLLVLAIRMAGFEVRDTIAWMYGSGLPKSLDVSKAIDRAAGAERPVVARVRKRESFGIANSVYGSGPDHGGMLSFTAPATPEAAAWEGWGTALKPAFEPVVVARKPLAGTVAANVLRYGTGALNIDACRIAFRSDADEREAKQKNRHADFGSGPPRSRVYGLGHRDRGNYDAEGRWPANVVIDEDAAVALDEQSGMSRSLAGRPRAGVAGGGWGLTATGSGDDDAGGASRFFYCAKASAKERSAGLEGRNLHPTVKPVALMRWLLRLVTPPGGIVLDPFAGSGSTLCAGAVEGIVVVGVERDREYAEIARLRVAWWAEHGEAAVERAKARRQRREELQMEMDDDRWVTVRVLHAPGCAGACGEACEREVLA